MGNAETGIGLSNPFDIRYSTFDTRVGIRVLTARWRLAFGMMRQ